MIAPRKYALTFLVILTIFYPSTCLSQDSRGFTATSTSHTPEAAWGTYHALIVGINAYKEWNPLQTAVKDAEALKDILIQRYGFRKENVTLRTNSDATRLRLIHDLRNLASNLQNQENLLIYFAGHGQLDDLTGDGYWIPVEGKLKDPVTWISHSTIKNILGSEKVRGKNIVIIADSCYSGSLLRSGPSLLSITERGYRDKLIKLASRRSRQVITSGGLEPVADRGRDGHSLFAYYLLKALEENNRDLIDLENLFHNRVWKYVTEIGGQRPNVGRIKTPMDEDGQFVLIGRLQHSLETDKRKPAEVHKQQEEIQHQQLAYVPKTALQEQLNSRYTLAIFPFKYEFDFTEEFIKGLFEVISDSQLFYPKLTYYDTGYVFIDGVRFNPRMIHKKFMTPDVIKKLWIKKSFFSSPEPNVEFICKLGRDLQVDAIILFHIESERTYNYIPRNATVFLINTNNKKLYSEKHLFNVDHALGFEVIEDIKRLTERVLNNFAKDKS